MTRRLLDFIESLNLVEVLRFQLTLVVRRYIPALHNPLPRQSATVQAPCLAASWQTQAGKVVLV